MAAISFVSFRFDLFCFVSFRFDLFRFVSICFVSFRFVSFRFVSVSFRTLQGPQNRHFFKFFKAFVKVSRVTEDVVHNREGCVQYQLLFNSHQMEWCEFPRNYSYFDASIYYFVFL